MPWRPARESLRLASLDSLARSSFVRGCPRGEELGVPFAPALARARTSIYGQRFQTQARTYISGPRNTELVAAMLVVGNMSVVPGEQTLASEVRKRCGKHAPYGAWAFVFHRFFVIVPDYEPVFVTRTTKGWYVF